MEQIYLKKFPLLYLNLQDFLKDMGFYFNYSLSFQLLFKKLNFSESTVGKYINLAINYLDFYDSVIYVKILEHSLSLCL